MLIRIIEIVFSLSMLIFLVTQVIIPVLQSRALFPSFKKTGKLEGEIVDAHQEMHDVRLVHEVERLKAEAAAEAAKQVTPSEPPKA